MRLLAFCSEADRPAGEPSTADSFEGSTAVDSEEAVLTGTNTWACAWGLWSLLFSSSPSLWGGARASPADSAGPAAEARVEGAGPTAGTFAATVARGGDIRAHDLLTGFHDGTPRGDVLVLEARGTRLVVIPAPGFGGTLVSGDRLVFKERLTASPTPAVAPSSTTAAVPTPSGPLRVERADHMVNPLPPTMPNVARAELHGVVIVRNVDRQAARDCRVQVRMLEEHLEFSLGTLAPGHASSTEWSLVRMGDESLTVEVKVDATIEGRPVELSVDSQERVPVDPRKPGEAPPGY